MNTKFFIAAFALLTMTTMAEAKSKCCKKKVKCKANEVSSKIIDSVSLSNKIDTISYFLGMQIGADMERNGASDINPDALKQGLSDALKKSASKVDMQTGMVYAQSYFMEKQAIKKAAEEAVAKKFFDDLAANPNIKTTASGLRYEVVKDTVGEKPLATDKVTVHYTGTLVNGKVFDSSEGGEPVTFPLNQVIKGWTEGVQLMSIGAKYKFYIPGNLAYGEQGVPQAGIGPNETLIFDVELLKIEKPAPQLQQAPSNIKIEQQ